MKFTKLSKKLNKLFKKKKKNKTIKPEKIQKLLLLLNEKKQKYEKKLNTDLTPQKRVLLKSKLTVVEAHIAKSEKLLMEQEQYKEPVKDHD